MVALTYCFDLDNTLCVTIGTEYESSQPINSRIQIVNKLFDSGHTIKIFTARGSGTGLDWTKVTKSQLQSWGVRYHELLFGKPVADFYVDDKAKDLAFFLDLP